MGLANLKGRVVIDNAASPALQQIKRDLDAIASSSKRINFAGLNSFAANATRSLQHQLDRMQKMAAPGSAALAGAGLGVRGVIEQTKDFNEAKFGYGFARLSDYLKDGKFDLQAWRAEMDKTAKEVQAKAKEVGTLPAYVMKAREEVEKLGFKGNESSSIYDAALGLHLSEPQKLATGQAAQFMGAVYRAFEGERKKTAARLGKDAEDPEFVRSYIQGLAAKAAIAGAESALGPSDVVEGMRQYAPQWAGLGISYDFSLAALAHGANYGFRAPELGTAYKSMAMKAIKPTAEGMRWYNRLGIDRSKYMDMDVADPKRATNQLDALLGNALGKNNKQWLEQQLIVAQKTGATTSPEFRGQLINNLEKRLGRGWVGRRAELESAYDDAFLAPTKFKEGGFDGLIREIIKSKAGPAALGTMFEGRHIARNDPMFSFYDKMYALFEKIQGIDGSFMDAVLAGRKSSEAGKTSALQGSWENLMIQIEQSGGIIDKVKESITSFNQSLAAMPAGALTTAAGAITALAGLGVVGAAVKAAPVVGAGARAAWSMTGIPALAGTAVGVYGGAKVAGKVNGLFGAGAASAGAGGVLGVVRRLVPAIMAGYVGYEGYQGYQKDGWWGAAKAAGWAINPLSIFMPGAANAATPGAAGADAIPSLQDAMASLPAATTEIATAGTDMAAQIRAVMAEVEAGFRSGTASVVAALDEAAGNIRAAGAAAGGGGQGPLRVPLNTGPTMQGN
jgi:hypothetical protein